MSKTIGKLSESRAAVSVTRLFWGDSTESELRNNNGWQSDDGEYRAEFLASLHFLADIEALGKDDEIQSFMDLPVAREPRRRGRFWIGAAAVVMLMLSVVLYQVLPLESSIHQSVDRYVSEIGSIESIALPDGSELTLNSGTELIVSMTEDERTVMLRRGEVYLNVAKDSNRPFSVAVGNQKVTVLGTSFSVRKQPSQINVMVEEGVVCVHPESEPASANAPLVGDATATAQKFSSSDLFRVSAGWLVDVDLTKNRVTASNDPSLADYHSWRQGYLEFVRQPLYVVVSKLNRYSARKIVLEDPSIMNLEVSAIIYIDQLNQSVRDLQKVIPVTVVSHFDRIILTSKK